MSGTQWIIMSEVGLISFDSNPFKGKTMNLVWFGPMYIFLNYVKIEMAKSISPILGKLLCLHKIMKNCILYLSSFKQRRKSEKIDGSMLNRF